MNRNLVVCSVPYRLSPPDVLFNRNVESLLNKRKLGIKDFLQIIFKAPMTINNIYMVI